jgi:hypothetical protein
MDSITMETVDDIAERIDRAGDRYRNSGDLDLESQSRIFAEAVRRCSSADRAREIARDFESKLRPRSSPGNGSLSLAGRSPRRPWWKWWRSGHTDDS